MIEDAIQRISPLFPWRKSITFPYIPEVKTDFFIRTFYPNICACGFEFHSISFDRHFYCDDASR